MQNAVIRQQTEKVKLLLKSPSVDVNILCEYHRSDFNYIMAPLHEAVKNENMEIIKLLLEKENININLVCKIEINNASYHEYKCFDETALHLAIESENIEIVKTLLQNEKIDVNFPYLSYYKFVETDYTYGSIKETKRKISALALAISKNDIEIVKLLLKNKKVDVNMPVIISRSSEESRGCGSTLSAKDEEIPLLYSVLNQIFGHNYDLFQLLLRNEKIDVNIPYKCKGDETIIKTCLHSAVQRGDVEIVKMLLQNKNIKLNVVDNFQKKPIDYADNYEEIKQLLTNHS